MAARLGALRHPLAAARAGRWKKNLTVVEAHTPFSCVRACVFACVRSCTERRAHRLHGPTHPSFNFMKHPSWYNEQASSARARPSAAETHGRVRWRRAQVLQAYHPAMEGHWTKGRTAFWLYAIVLAGVGVVVGTAEYQQCVALAARGGTRPVAWRALTLRVGVVCSCAACTMRASCVVSRLVCMSCTQSQDGLQEVSRETLEILNAARKPIRAFIVVRSALP